MGKYVIQIRYSEDKERLRKNWELLKQLAKEEGRFPWRLLNDAIEKYLEEKTGPDREEK